jgi:hypothetical protein
MFSTNVFNVLATELRTLSTLINGKVRERVENGYLTTGSAFITETATNSGLGVNRCAAFKAFSLNALIWATLLMAGNTIDCVR